MTKYVRYNEFYVVPVPDDQAETVAAALNGEVLDIDTMDAATPVKVETVDPASVTVPTVPVQTTENVDGQTTEPVSTSPVNGGDITPASAPGSDAPVPATVAPTVDTTPAEPAAPDLPQS